MNKTLKIVAPAKMGCGCERCRAVLGPLVELTARVNAVLATMGRGPANEATALALVA